MNVGRVLFLDYSSQNPSTSESCCSTRDLFPLPSPQKTLSKRPVCSNRRANSENICTNVFYGMESIHWSLEKLWRAALLDLLQEQTVLHTKPIVASAIPAFAEGVVLFLLRFWLSGLFEAFHQKPVRWCSLKVEPWWTLRNYVVAFLNMALFLSLLQHLSSSYLMARLEK